MRDLRLFFLVRRIMGVVVNATIAIAVTFAFTVIASADEIKLPGTTITYKTYIEGEGGYDSNPDNLFNHVGSAFEKIEGSFSATSTTKTETYELLLKARDVEFNDLSLDNRWDFKAALNSSFVTGPGQNLAFRTYYFRDFFSLDRVEILHSSAEYTVTGDDFRVKIENRTHVEHNLSADTLGLTQTQDEFNISAGRAFDFARIDGRLSTIVSTKAMLQPFLIYDFGDVDYYNQVSGASIDRTARDQFVIAGLRFAFDKSFRVDVGGRYNRRDFDDKTVPQFDRGFIDINAFWQPTDAFKATLIVERYMTEPSTAFGLADDVRSVGTTADWQFAPLWRLSLAGYYDRVDAVEDIFRYNKYTGIASITYEPTKSVEIFLSGLGRFVSEETTGDSYTRYKIGSGVRFKF